MSELEFTGKTIEDAKKNALSQLGLSEDNVEFTVIHKGRSGLLGLRSYGAKVRAKIKEDTTPQNTSYIQEAKRIMEELVTLLGLEAKVRLLPGIGDGSPTTLNLEGDDLGVLIGRRGQTLAALQYLVRLIVSEKSKTWVSINIDIAGYKKKRYESLKKLAMRLADHVKTTKRPINLEPMPPDERRIIHLTLANNPDISTQSIDEGEKRKVVIQYRKR